MKAAREETTTGPIYKWVILACASLGLFLGTLDMMVNVALPNITEYFDTDIQTIQWIILSFMVGRTGLQISLGRAADLYGLKRFFVIGVALYTVAVALIGLSPSLLLIFALRLVQAVGAGMVGGSVPALVTRAFPARERGIGLGFMGVFALSGMLMGTFGGGFLVDAFGWRAIFLARVPIGILLILSAVLILPRQKSTSRRESFDVPGAIALFVGLAGLLMALNMGGRLGWTSPIVAVLGIVSFMAISLFLYVEKRSASPVLDLRLLRYGPLKFVLLAGFLMNLGSFVDWFILPYYVADTLNQQARALGLILAIAPLIAAMVSPISGWLSDRVPSAYLISLALATVFLSKIMLSLLTATSTTADVAIAMSLTGFGFGVFQAANANLVMSSVPSNRLATGASLMTLFVGMGAVFSVAISSIIFSSRLDVHTMTLAQQGLVGDAASAGAFVLAFQDTYRLSALAVILGVVTSLLAWSRRDTRLN